jgi:hypothetical protein
MLLGRGRVRSTEEGNAGDSPALLLVELVAHALGELLKVALWLCIVGVYHEVLEMPKPPTNILETLALLKIAGDLCADLPSFSQSFWVIEIAECDKRLVSLK